MKIITDPTRGSHDAYAVTQEGVYYMANSTASGATWKNITGNLFSLTINPFGNRRSQAQHRLVNFLNSIQADWRVRDPVQYHERPAPRGHAPGAVRRG